VTPSLKPGQLVLSRAGRDRGQLFIVVAVEDGHFARVADGRLRPADRPKRKNVRHLQPQGAIDAGLAARAAHGEAPTDLELREAIAAFRRGQDRGDAEMAGWGASL
jgi:large subunit ribosomal protein L14e